MNIGVLTTSYPRRPTDPAGNFVAGLCQVLAERGASVEVIAAGPGQTRDGAVRIHRLPGHDLFYGGGAPERLARDRAAWGGALRFSARPGRSITVQLLAFRMTKSNSARWCG